MSKFFTLLAALLLVILPASPASAHAFDVYNGNDWVHIGAEHQNMWVHDKECDGHWVDAQLKYGDSWVLTGQKDTNGCDSGGTQYSLGNADYVRLCEESVGCTGWRRID